jgi:hypothetical protein
MSAQEPYAAGAACDVMVGTRAMVEEAAVAADPTKATRGAWAAQLEDLKAKEARLLQRFAQTLAASPAMAAGA